MWKCIWYTIYLRKMVYKVMINLSTWLLVLLVRKLQHREHKYNYKFTVIISLHKHSFSKLSNNPQSSFTNILSMQVMQKRIIYVHKLTLNAFKFCKTLHDGHFASWLIFISKIITAFQFNIICWKYCYHAETYMGEEIFHILIMYYIVSKNIHMFYR